MARRDGRAACSRVVTGMARQVGKGWQRQSRYMGRERARRGVGRGMCGRWRDKRDEDITIDARGGVFFFSSSF